MLNGNTASGDALPKLLAEELLVTPVCRPEHLSVGIAAQFMVSVV